MSPHSCFRQVVAPAVVLVCALLAAGASTAESRGCRSPPKLQPSASVVLNPLPWTSSSALPPAWDWRAARWSPDAGHNTTTAFNYCNRVLTQQAPRVCGSCWAEAATGALSDRYSIMTGNALRVQLAPQVLLNFLASNGDCMGGDAFDAYAFIHAQGITDDTCAPFTGQSLSWGFDYAGGSEEDDSLDVSHMCQACGWDGQCEWVPASDYDVYGIDEFGQVGGPKAGNYERRAEAMMAEIYARGPIACSIASDPPSFDRYRGGIITDQTPLNDTDHVIVLAGWGVSQTGLKYWIGRNSYGGRWGEGAGGGWFRVARGNNTLAIETYACSWAVPSTAHVRRALQQAKDSVASDRSTP